MALPPAVHLYGSTIAEGFHGPPAGCALVGEHHSGALSWPARRLCTGRGAP